MKTVISTIVLLSGALLAANSFAQDKHGNAGMQIAGMQIASSGAPKSGVPACASCHGTMGEGNAASGFPRLAGQSKTYLARQLAAYAGGSRNNAVMAPVAKALTQQQIDAVAAYYAALPATPPRSAQASGQGANGDKGDMDNKRGQTLATVGDEKLGVQGCANCHGPGGAGEAPTYPYLASQHKAYLVAAMGEWKSGARNTDPSTQMNMIAKRLGDGDIAALAAYFSSQPPPLNRSNMPAQAGPGTHGAQTSTAPVRGTGTEQGAATSGGSQGPGGGGAASGGGPSGTPK